MCVCVLLAKRKTSRQPRIKEQRKSLQEATTTMSPPVSGTTGSIVRSTIIYHIKIAVCSKSHGSKKWIYWRGSVSQWKRLDQVMQTDANCIVYLFLPLNLSVFTLYHLLGAFVYPGELNASTFAEVPWQLQPTLLTLCLLMWPQLLPQTM